MLSASQLCAAAAAAYSAPATFVCAGDVHVVVSEIDGITIIAFRGTEPDCLADWLRDFDAIEADGGPLGECHEGFLTGAGAAMPFLLPIIAGKQFAIVGHSLGGALAICATGLLVARGISPLLCTTFGAPAVSADGVLGRLIAHVPGVRYHNGDDPVPFVPPCPYAQDRAMTGIGKWVLDPIADHMIASYALALMQVPILSAA